MSSDIQVPFAINEPVSSFARGTEERESLKRTIKELAGKEIEIPLIGVGLGGAVVPGLRNVVEVPILHTGLVDAELSARIDALLRAGRVEGVGARVPDERSGDQQQRRRRHGMAPSTPLRTRRVGIRCDPLLEPSVEGCPVALPGVRNEIALANGLGEQ